MGERETLTELRDVRRRMVGDLMRRLRAGKITPRTVDGQRRSKFRGQKQAEGRLQRLFDRVGREGAGHVDEELRRQ